MFFTFCNENEIICVEMRKKAWLNMYPTKYTLTTRYKQKGEPDASQVRLSAIDTPMPRMVIAAGQMAL